jgi:hypothetical protein
VKYALCYAQEGRGGVGQNSEDSQTSQQQLHGARQIGEGPQPPGGGFGEERRGQVQANQGQAKDALRGQHAARGDRGRRGHE